MFAGSEVFSGLKEGGYAFLAVLLFIGNFLQNAGIKSALKTLTTEVKNSHTAAVADIAKVATGLADSTKNLMESLSKVLESQHSMLATQQVQGTNQLNQTHALNEVVRELISIIRDGERN